jgi:hypothetical protein
VTPPIVMPDHLGQPCWTSASVAEVMRTVAQTSDETAIAFLAAHAPSSTLLVDGDTWLDERKLLASLTESDKRDHFAVVVGDPGSGKSHLIRWLHLQVCRTGGAAILPVLIRRRDGTLRDAVRQFVSELPDQYARHLERMRNAVSGLDLTNARYDLTLRLASELHTRGGRSGLLRDIDQLCTSNGTRRWLTREGGVVDQVVRRLIHEAHVDERHELPTFTGAELCIDTPYKNDNTAAVHRLIDEIDDGDDDGPDSFASRIANHFNEVLRPAVRTMQGLSDVNFKDTLDGIRREIKGSGQRLAVFLEDVSVLAALDEQMLAALEPSDDAALAPMTAIIGMTRGHFSSLPDNRRQRMTLTVDVGSDGGTGWRQNEENLVRFVARYLNASRLSAAGLQAVISERQEGHDPGVSACDACVRKRECHDAFGTTTFDDTEIGLFPFTRAAIPLLLEGIAKRHGEHRANPRGLIQHVLLPVLNKEREPLRLKHFPATELAVQLPEPTFWTSLENLYLGGWSVRDRARAKRLVKAWAPGRNADEAIQRLLPLSTAIGLPAFTGRESPTPRADQPKKPAKGTDASAAATPQGAPEPEVQPGQSDSKLQQHLTALAAWVNGDPLDFDEEPRSLLLKLLMSSVPWPDTGVTPEAWGEALGAANRAAIVLEGQSARLRAGQVASFRFARSKAIAGVIEALLRWKYLGKETWAFEHSELHRRNVIRWVRTVTPALIEALNGPSEQRRLVLAHALQASRLGQAIGTGAMAPWSPKAVSLLLQYPIPGKPLEVGVAAVDSAERALVTRIQSAAENAVTFLRTETLVPQGNSAGLKFFDAVTLLDVIKLVRTGGGVLLAPVLDATTRWGRRYRKALDEFEQGDAKAQVATRREALEAHVIQSTIHCLQYCGRDVLPTITVLEELHRAMSLLLEEEHVHYSIPFADREFVAQRIASSPQGKALRQVIEEIMTALASQPTRTALEQAEAVLSIDGFLAAEAVRLHHKIMQYCQQLDTSLTDNEKVAADEDPVLLRKAIGQRLASLAARLDVQGEEEENG